MSKKTDLYNEKYYIPRDLSWLEFNRRVLNEGLNEDVPLAERLKFLAITSSNLDEFFKVRVASARQTLANGSELQATAAKELLRQISRQTHALTAVQNRGILEAFRRLKRHGIVLKRYESLDEKRRSLLRSHFEREILPIITPLAIEDLEPTPILPALQLHVALHLQLSANAEFFKAPIGEPDENAPNADASTANAPNAGTPSKDAKARKKTGLPPELTGEFIERLAIVPVPTQCSRWICCGETAERTEFVMLEEVIADNADLIFPGCEVLHHAIVRITRDEDVRIDEDMTNYTEVVENAVLSRKHRTAVRLECSAGMDPYITDVLLRLFQLTDEDVYESSIPLDATALFELAEHPRLQSEKYETWTPVDVVDLQDSSDLFERVASDDVLIFLPYEKFTPVVELLERAAEDPNVLAIKQTLYRTSGDSPIVKALIKAARNGKEVVALVELRARFDEYRNIRWTRMLEDAGCHVIYGIAGLKTHAKAMLIVRREKGRIIRYVHLSTGNYNDKTARLYSDFGLMTCNREITADVAAFFNMLTGYSETVGWRRLTTEPILLKRKFIELIEREIAASTPQQPGWIRAKLNALEDRNVIEALYRASRKGVRIDLNIRGICCLRPGIKGVSENIHVRSIIDRYLEHSRIFYFQNGGMPEVYLASSDWMVRNLEHRLEILFPILSPRLRERLIHCLDVYFADNVKACTLDSRGRWTKLTPGPRAVPVRAQEVFHFETLQAAAPPDHPPLRYVPLKRPEE